MTLEACNGSNNQQTSTGQQWIIQEGNNQGVKLFGTNLCLDAQTNPTAGRPTLVYPCIGTGPQTWVSISDCDCRIVLIFLQYLTPDDRVAITGGTQCLSASGGNAETQDCAPGVDAEVSTGSVKGGSSLLIGFAVAKGIHPDLLVR